MGITPIGPLAMLPLMRSDVPELEPMPMARVESSVRTEDETYSPSNEGDDSPSGSKEPANQQSGSQAQENDPSGEGEALEAANGLSELLTSGAPSFDLPSDSAAKINFFA